MFSFKKKNKLVTHNNHFHADDVFATAVLLILLGKKNCEVVRTRDEKDFESGDYVYDVGGVYNPNKKRFDHHQEGFGEKRENGIPYSSFGLVWKEYGEQICGSKKIAEDLDKKIAWPIDSIDNGIETYQMIIDDLRPYTITNLVGNFNPIWGQNDSFDNLFLEAVDIAKKVLKREITRQKNVEKARIILGEIYDKTEDKRIIILDDNYPVKNLLNEYSEPIFSVKKVNDGWTINAVRESSYSFGNRKDLPESWAGKRDEELAEITGVNDATFCHKARFIAGAKSKEGAIKLAKLALSSKE